MPDIPPICTLDIESRSPVDLRKTGPWPYAEHPDTDLWCICWAIEDGPIHRWHPGDDIPDDVRHFRSEGGWFEFWNAGFEHAMWSRIMTPRYGWPELPLEQISDGMIRACVMGLPRGLEDCGIALKMPVQKDKEGHRLMMQMARPRKPRKDEDTSALLWWDDAERIERLTQYCERDVEVQRAIGQRLRHLTPTERDWFLRTTRMNYRGIRIDTEFVDRAITCMDVVKQQQKRDIAELTGHAVTSPTQVGNIKAWLAEQGCELESLDKNLVAELVETGQVPETALPVLEIRAQGGKSSVSKLPAFQHHVCADGRIRGEFVHHGAGRTGRDAGAGCQLQNLPSRGGLPWQDAAEVAQIVKEHQATEAVELVDMLYAPTPTALSSCLRGVLRASEGQRIYCADFSNIEGRFAAWLAGERWKLDAFRAFDDGTGHDLYKIAAAGILGCSPADIDKALRDALGKVSELQLQFGGGVGAWLTMAKNYRVEVADYWDVIRDAVAPSVIERTFEAWEQRGKKSGIEETTWKAAEAVKVAWRDRHPAIVQAWHDHESAAVNALRNPGSAHMVCGGRAGFSCRKIHGTPFLLQRLPSGRLLYFAYPWLEEKETPWGTTRPQIRYWGTDPITKKWCRQSTYGGDRFQSCLAKGTPVLTSTGWKPIEGITSADRLWDGEAWVFSEGAICNGVRPVIDLAGVLLTEDHEVLTNEGWKTASQSEGHYRAASRLPDGAGIRWQRWEEIPVVGSVRLRSSTEVPRQRAHEDEETRQPRILRVPALGEHQQTNHPARDVPPSGVPRLGLDDCPVLSVIFPVVGELRRKGRHCLQTVAYIFREFLGRHGADLPAGAVVGQGGQQRQLLPGKLPVGGPADAVQQQAPHQVHPWRPRQRGGGKDRHFTFNAALPPGPRLARGQVAPETGFSTQVFDILNCGPKRRFVVRGADGLPVIVHNCVQGGARDVMMHGAVNAEDAGYQMLLRVHDEIAAEHADGSLTEFERLMCDLPDWAEGLPVTAKGYVADNYRKD